jgi:hypothetical protein
MIVNNKLIRNFFDRGFSFRVKSHLKRYSGGNHNIHKTLDIMINIVTCQRTARQRIDKHPAIRARNSGTTGLCNPLLSNRTVYNSTIIGVFRGICAECL